MTTPIALWKPEYETGYTLIDDQHRSLFHAINALHGAIMAGRGEELLERSLKFAPHPITAIPRALTAHHPKLTPYTRQRTVWERLNQRHENSTGG